MDDLKHEALNNIPCPSDRMMNDKLSEIRLSRIRYASATEAITMQSRSVPRTIGCSQHLINLYLMCFTVRNRDVCSLFAPLVRVTDRQDE